MALQTRFNSNMASAFAGMWYDISDTEAYGRSAEFSAIPFGVAVVKGTNDNQVRLPDDGGYLATLDPLKVATDPAVNTFEGISMYHAPNARCAGEQLKCPIGDDEFAFLAETETVSVATHGRFYVVTKSDVVKGGPVFFRHTLTDAAAVPQLECLGELRGDDDGGNATEIVGARWVHTAAAGEMSIVQLTGAVQA